jgi:hypothetical protein
LMKRADRRIIQQVMHQPTAQIINFHMHVCRRRWNLKLNNRYIIVAVIVR